MNNEKKTLGQIAYESQSGSQQIPWEELYPINKRLWEASATSVRDAVLQESKLATDVLHASLVTLSLEVTKMEALREECRQKDLLIQDLRTTEQAIRERVLAELPGEWILVSNPTQNVCGGDEWLKDGNWTPWNGREGLFTTDVCRRRIRPAVPAEAPVEASPPLPASPAPVEEKPQSGTNPQTSFVSGDTVLALERRLLEVTRERDESQGELNSIREACARRPALDKPTLRENIEHALSTAVRKTDDCNRLESELAGCSRQLGDVTRIAREQRSRAESAEARITALTSENTALLETLSQGEAFKRHILSRLENMHPKVVAMEKEFDRLSWKPIAQMPTKEDADPVRQEVLWRAWDGHPVADRWDIGDQVLHRWGYTHWMSIPSLNTNKSTGTQE